MITLRFKTNINCGGCIAKVTPFLNAEKSILKWEVDTKHPDKILTVEGENLKQENIISKVREAGYKISPDQV
jgi:copper chaperone